MKILRSIRLGPLAALAIFAALVAAAVWAVFAVMRTIPQRTVVMAAYPEGSLNAELVKRYQEVLAREGIKLKPAPSAGAVESLALLRDPKSNVNVALVPEGLTTAEESPGLVSLGTMYYQPLWIFTRGRLLQGNSRPRGLRISIGPEGSSSHAFALMLLSRAGIIDKKTTTLLTFTPSESAEKLIRGEIDAAVLLEGWESPVVQQLLVTKGVRLLSMARADAFVALYPYLSKLELPAGVVDMSQPWPRKEVVLIAPKSSLVVRDDIDPAIQYLLLQAAVEIHSTPGIFRDAGEFPAAESIGLPLSPYARDFYKKGLPFLQRHLPFWLAVLIQRPILWLIPLVVVLFPILRLAPIVYDWAEKRRIYKLYDELKRLENEMPLAVTSGTTNDLIERLDRLKQRASHLSVPTPFKPLVYALRLHIDMVRQEAQKASTGVDAVSAQFQ
jgi:TRAP-type uncharacterized transport system substrate-binding protein